MMSVVLRPTLNGERIFDAMTHDPVAQFVKSANAILSTLVLAFFGLFTLFMVGVWSPKQPCASCLQKLEMVPMLLPTPNPRRELRRNVETRDEKGPPHHD